MSAHVAFSRSLLMAGIGGILLLDPSCSANPSTTEPAYKHKPPQAEKRPVLDEYHGIQVTDPYRWLENGSDPKVREWSDAQNAAARAYLNSLPGIEGLRQRMQQLLTTGSPSYSELHWAGDRLFALKKQPPLQQPLLVALRSASEPGSEAVLCDPNVLDPKGTTSIDWYVPSFDGRLVAIAISGGGSESGDVHVIDANTTRELGDLVPRVNGGTAGGSLAWSADGSGFYYTRYPRAGERPEEELGFFQQVYYHKLGDPVEQDRYEIGRAFPPIAEIRLEASKDGRYVLASVQNGDGGEFTHHVRIPAGEWVQVTRYDDRCVLAALGEDRALYLVSRLRAPRGKVLRLPLESGTPKIADAVEIVAQREDSISTEFGSSKGIRPTSGLIYVLYQEGGPNTVRVFDHAGSALGELATLPVSSVGEMVAVEGDDLLFQNQSHLLPPAWYRYRPADRSSARTQLVETSAADFSDCQVIRDVAISKDGARIPISVILREGTKLDGNNPTLLYGYGGYGISMTPTFRPQIRAWLDRGGVYAIANLRGGGEFGEDWHRAGNLEQKQNVFDDFAAVARHLIANGCTRPERLAWLGGSNGGLLMGAMITQHPDLARAVVSSVGIYDMLRVELTPNGAFNVTEFGTVKDPSLFRALYAYSPYHHVVDGGRYPSILMLTGENDPRVAPWHSRKMIARLQAASVPGRPILLRTSGSTGHGIGTALRELVEEYVDIYGFLFHELGVD